MNCEQNNQVRVKAAISWNFTNLVSAITKNIYVRHLQTELLLTANISIEVCNTRIKLTQLYTFSYAYPFPRIFFKKTNRKQLGTFPVR